MEVVKDMMETTSHQWWPPPGIRLKQIISHVLILCPHFFFGFRMLSTLESAKKEQADHLQSMTEEKSRAEALSLEKEEMSAKWKEETVRK